MLPTDNNALLQQHLLQRRLLAANHTQPRVRQLQAPPPAPLSRASPTTRPSVLPNSAILQRLMAVENEIQQQKALLLAAQQQGRVKQQHHHPAGFGINNSSLLRFPQPHQQVAKPMPVTLPFASPAPALKIIRPGPAVLTKAASAKPTLCSTDVTKDVLKKTETTKKARNPSLNQNEAATPSSSPVIARSKAAVPEAVAAALGAPNVSRKDLRWKEMYEELKVYKAEHGACTVPRGYPENPRLASWVAEQRKQYKLMSDGRQSSITSERIRLLNEIDFAWNAQEAAWGKHMRDLKAFKEEHGNTHVPLGDPKYPKLGLWVKEQRRHYTLMKQGKQSHMTEARCEELDRVGFCWDTHEATWLERLNELKEYKRLHGNCTVPTNYPDNPKLGTWIHHQRRQYKKFKEGKTCHITTERIKALDSLGFVWYPRDKTPAKSEKSRSSTDLAGLDLRPRKRQRTSE